MAYRFTDDERNLLRRMKEYQRIWVIERNRQEALRHLVTLGMAKCMEGTGEDRGLLIGWATPAGSAVSVDEHVSGSTTS